MLVAQLDRVLDYESNGWKFESFQAYFAFAKQKRFSLKKTLKNRLILFYKPKAYIIDSVNVQSSIELVESLIQHL